jgi:protein-tyrosine-phosphatase
MKVPLFVCHANCCRSVLASYLYRHLCGAAALSAAMEVGDCINDRALAMLDRWGIDARGHSPRQLNRPTCDQAAGIFLMAPAHAR